MQSLHKGRELIAVDTLVAFPLYAYRGELHTYWHKSADVTETLVDSIDWSSDADQTIQLDFLRQLRVKGARPAELIYFSRVTLDHLLIAETMPEKRGAGLSHDDQSAYNNCTQYLFVFDDNDKIKKVFVHRDVLYN